ncbi:MAG: DUF535 family protein [Ostreibacterium sp.]
MKIYFKQLRHYISSSLFATGWQLASKGYANDNPTYRRKQQWKIIFHVLLNPKFAYQWFKFLESPEIKEVTLYRPRLYIKPFRVYISTQWNKERKVKIILDTYRFIESKTYLFSQIVTHKEGILITDLLFNDTHKAHLKLGYDRTFRKEGELVLSLECTELGGKIVSVAFSLEETTAGHWSCLVGCVQGHDNSDEQNAFKLTQRFLHGLRPNAFIIYSLQELSKQLDFNNIYCTGNSIQAHLKKHAIHFPWKNINFDYNQFWLEVGGQNKGKGWFVLPLIPVRKDLQEIKSKKRSMYRKRYDMLDQLSTKITNKVKTLQATS